MMNRDTIAVWVDGYVQAWQTNDPATIGQLFAEDATYATGPFDSPWRGRDAIVAGWLRRRDEPQTWTFHYEVLATSPDGGVVRGWTTYPQRQQAYSNIWLLALDEVEHDQFATALRTAWRSIAPKRLLADAN